MNHAGLNLAYATKLDVRLKSSKGKGEGKFKDKEVTPLYWAITPGGELTGDLSFRMPQSTEYVRSHMC